MRARLSWIFAFAIGCGLQQHGATAHAQSQGGMEDPYFAAKLMLGLGGEGEVDTGPVTVSDDLLLTWGGGFQYMHPLHRYFALGGTLSLQSWQTESWDDANLDRNMLVDLAIVPAGKLALSDDIELYVTLPLGISMDFFGEDAVNVAGVVLGDVNDAIGFTLGLMLGARFALSDSAGLLAELGYVAHSYEHEVTVGAVGFSASDNFDLSLGQFALNLGAYF